MSRDDDNAKLIAALHAQDPAVARLLWKRFAPRTFRLLGRTLGPEAPVDAAVEVVLLCAFHRGARVRSEGKLNELVLKITAQVARAELRRVPAREPFRSTDDAMTRFYRILDRLGPGDRIAFVFHHIENLDVRVVAAAMGGTVSGTTRRLRRALRMVFDGIQRDPVLRALPEPRSRATRDSVMFEATTRAAAVPRARSSAR